MKWFANLIRKIIEKWRDWFVPPYQTMYVEDLPEKLKRKTIYIIRDERFIEHASLLCPCGCGALLHMNLIPDERPCWFVTSHKNGAVSLKPSVWRQKGCRSHFSLPVVEFSGFQLESSHSLESFFALSPNIKVSRYTGAPLWCKVVKTEGRP